MKRWIIMLAVALLSGLASGAAAYDIDQLIADARAFHGNQQTQFEDLTVRFEGTFSTPTSKGSKISSVHYQKGDKWRDEGEMAMDGTGSPQGGNLSTVTLFDGVDIWTLAMGMKMKLSPEQMTPGQGSTPGYWQEPVAGSTVIGDAKVSGRECWIIQGPTNPMMKSPPKTWIDKKHFVFVRNETVLSEEVIRTDFSDFRKVKGDFVIPHRYEVFSGDQKTMSGEIKELALDSGLSDDLFDPEKLGGDQPDIMNMDVDALMKQADEMRKKAEEMQKKYGGGK